MKNIIVYDDYLIIENQQIKTNLIKESQYLVISETNSKNLEITLLCENKIHIIINDSKVTLNVPPKKKIKIFKEFYNCEVTFKIDGTLKINSLIIPTFKSKNIINFNLCSYQATLDVYDSALVNNQNHYDEIVNINHFHKSSFSDYAFYGIAKNKAFLGLNATSTIAPHMNKSEAHQKIAVIVMDQAKTEAHPSLVIDNYDVKASHANSIGQISPDHIYYLNARGINKEDATKLIVMGYFSPVLETFSEDIKEKITNLIAEA